MSAPALTAPSMQAVYLTGHGGNEVVCVGPRPRPEPAAGEVRVRLQAATLNRVDLYMRESGAGITHTLPQTMGIDGAGVVDALGADVSGCAVGQRVLLYPGVTCGHCESAVKGEIGKVAGVTGVAVDLFLSVEAGTEKAVAEDLRAALCKLAFLPMFGGLAVVRDGEAHIRSRQRDNDAWQASSRSDIEEGCSFWDQGCDMEAVEDMALPNALAFTWADKASFNPCCYEKLGIGENLALTLRKVAAD